MEWVGDDHGAAVDAGGAQVMQSLEMAALALPVADRKVDEVQLGDIAEVGDGENGDEDRLQPVIFPFGGQFVHLQKTLIGTALHFNQVRDLNRGRDLGKIGMARFSFGMLHSWDSWDARWGKTGEPRESRSPPDIVACAMRVTAASIGENTALVLETA
jgi:hypothetical protein